MKQKLLVISGKKCSGKSSLANFLVGYEMRRNDIIKWFDITDNGKLQVPANFEDVEGNVTNGVGVMDLDRQDEEFIEFAEQFIWPYVKVYSFADRLKQILMLLFGISFERLYGSDEQKNKPTDIKWSDVKFLLSEEMVEKLSKKQPDESFAIVDSWNKYMTGREMAQIFGSDVCRKIKNNCWVEACYADILHEGYPFVIIADARFPNELNFMKDVGAKLVRLTRKPFDDNHVSETALDSYDKFDLVIDNVGANLKEKNQAMLKYLLEIGWTGTVLE